MALSRSAPKLNFHMNNQQSKYIYSVKLKAGKTGSAVVVEYPEGYYLVSALHVINETNTAQIIDINNEVADIDISNKIESSKDVDICVMKVPDDIAERFVVSAKSASFEGSGYPCEIDGFPTYAPDKRIRIEDECVIDKESEVGDSLYVKLKEQRTDGLKMEDIKGGFSGSGVFVDSNGEKYVIGIVYKVDDICHHFIGWKMQKINDILRENNWEEIPLTPIELNEGILEQYNTLIENSHDVLGRIHDSIIGQIRLERKTYKRAIKDAINRNNQSDVANVVIITGEAGIGKSVLAKAVLCETGINSVAILGDDLDKRSNSEILTQLGITEGLEKLYNSPVWGEGKKIVLIESAERMLNGNTDVAVLFIEKILKKRSDVTIVFTIRKHAVRMLRMNLMSSGVKVSNENVVEIGPLDETELREVEHSVQHISPFIASAKTRDIISIPYYLNIVCSLSTEDRENLDNEDLKNDLCRIIVEGKHDDEESAKQRVNSLIFIARESANNSMGLVKIAPSNTIVSLEDDEVVVGDLSNNKIRPNHDLLTDWALGKHIENLYHRYVAKELSLNDFYKNIDHNVASRNVFKSILKSKISGDTEDFRLFFIESMSAQIDDFHYDDLFYAVLDSDNGAQFLSRIKDVLMEDNGRLVQKIGKALSYMFRDIDFNGRRILEEHGLLEQNTKYRNSQFIVPVGKGWKTFVEFLYNNREVFKKYRKTFIPQLLECELVNIKEKEIGNLPQYVFEILLEDVEQWLHNDSYYENYNENIFRLLFKWIKRGMPEIKRLLNESLRGTSYKHELIRRFVLTDNNSTLGLIYYYTEIYKAIVEKDWIKANGIVEDYHNLHIASALSTSYYTFFLVKPKEAITLLCDILNYDIDKKRSIVGAEIDRILVPFNGKVYEVYGNAYLWREYRGVNYHEHVQECLLMAFEKWMLDSIRNNQNNARYAMSQDELLAVFDIVYTKCRNVSLWAVLAGIATCYPYFVGMKAMPIYSNLTFIHWDKTRLSSEIHRPFSSPFVSKKIREEIKESYERPHRKKDLENIILVMSMTKGYVETFEALMDDFKKKAISYNDKVSIGRMDKKQYQVVDRNEEGIILQGKPYDDIKEEANAFEQQSNKFTTLIEKGNKARSLYDVEDDRNYTEWKSAYALRGISDETMSPDCIVAAWGVKCFWQKLSCQEKRWCVRTVINDVEDYCRTHSYPLYIEYTSDALLHILAHKIDSKSIRKVVLSLIDCIDDNDAMFERFENTFKSLIWIEHPEVADDLIKLYLMVLDIEKDDLQKFTQICKLLPVTYIDEDFEELVEVYAQKYVDQWSLKKFNSYMHFHNTRVETFLANYILTLPSKRIRLIKEIWLNSLLNEGRNDERDNPVSNVFQHFSYLALKDNKTNFWQLWEIMFEWYQQHDSSIVLSALMLHFEIMRYDLLNDWEVLEDSKSHISKLLIALKDDCNNLLPNLLCRMGYKELLPDCLRLIDIKVLKQSSCNPQNFINWQNAVEDLYDDPATREEIRNNPVLRSAYVEILNALISNGSAIAYIIRDYYI